MVGQVARDEVGTALLQPAGEHLGIGDHRFGVGLEAGLQRFADGFHATLSRELEMEG